MPFGRAGKGLLEVEAAAEGLWRVIGHGPTSSSGGAAGVGKKEGFEPRSVLDQGRSPSPPTSASTFSSSLGGGGSTDSAGLAVVSGNTPRVWVPTQDATGSAMTDAAFGGGLGIGNWDSVLSEQPPAVGCPGPDQSFLRWMMGEIADPVNSSPALGLQQQEPHRMPPEVALDFEAGDGGGEFGLVHPAFGSMASTPPPASSAPLASAGEFSAMDGSNGDSSNGNSVLMIPPTPVPLSPPSGVAFQEPAIVGKPHCFSPGVLLSHQQVQFSRQNSAFHLQQDMLLPLHIRRHHSTVEHHCQNPTGSPFCDSGQDSLQWQHQQPQQCLESLRALPHHLQPVGGDEATTAATRHHYQQQQAVEALVDQLFKAAELVEAGNSANAGVVLARLNHQLSPVEKPIVRAAFYCKEALQSIITNNSNSTPLSTSLPLQQNPPFTALSTPVDVVLKLSAYKAFSEISPILQFTNFTCTQVLLEEFHGCDHIHIIDFDIGVGGQWPSFMLELAQRRSGGHAATPSLRITAVAPLSSHHSLELGLVEENLSRFADCLYIPFEFNTINSDPFDSSSLVSMLKSDEAIAVNLLSSACPSAPNLPHLLKQLSPKIVVSVDHGWDHNGLMFSHNFLRVLQSSTILLDSIDATGISPLVASKIERYLLQPRIENAVLGHHHAALKGLHSSTLFSSAGFTAVPFSSMTEAQAEYLLKKISWRGFLVEKRQASLLLCWHRGVLVSISAWKC